MSYATAAKCFEENIRITDPATNQEGYNLNVGLYQLVQALQQDSQNLQHEVAAYHRQSPD